MIPEKFIKDNLRKVDNNKSFENLTPYMKKTIEIRWGIYNDVKNKKENILLADYVFILEKKYNLSESTISNMIYKRKFRKINY